MIEIDEAEWFRLSIGYPTWFRFNSQEGWMMREQLYAQMLGLDEEGL